MKISLNWLQEFIDLTVTDPQEIGARVTAGVAEVDEVEVQGALLDHCIVGKIVKVDKHQGADRLSICQVQTDDGIKQIVCGGTNLRMGMKVAVAKSGARVRWHGAEMMTLQKTKIRGAESDGMICAAEELDLATLFPQATDKSIIDLGDGDEGVEQGLRDYLGLKDIILHIDNHAITHRADLFSQYGFAREFVALGIGTWKKKKDAPAPRFGKGALPFKCIVDDDRLVSRYASVALEIDGIGETPQWMKERLEATGWRSINLPIDITNYVATELGMPLHSFDATDIKGDVHMRGAEKDETIMTLDGVARDLPEGAIVLSDDEGIFDLLGIMGGLRSSTKSDTTSIYLHAAIVDPVIIRKTVIATGHRTDASTVYEKGVPKVMVRYGLDRAIQLFLELVPGARIASALEEWGDDGKATPIDLSLDYVSRLLGTQVTAKRATEILETLEFEVKASKKNADLLTVTPPLHRLGDVRGKHDLAEEIGRVIGYASIEATLPAAPIRPPSYAHRHHQVRDALKARLYTELLPLSFISPSLLKKAGFDPSQAIEVRNPLGEELSLLQTSTLPSLLEQAEHSILNGSTILRTFHWSHVFEKPSMERDELGLLLADLHVENRSIKSEPFLLLKQDLTTVFASLGFALDVVPVGSPPAFAHPGRYADILVRPVAESGDASSPSTPIGSLFEVHPDVSERFSLPHRAAAALLDMQAVLSLSSAPLVISPVPHFPAVTYDITLTLGHTEQATDIIRTLQGQDPLLESIAVTDIYSGSPLPDGEHTLTLRFTYRAPDRTLTEDEAKKVHEKVTASLKG